jgi:hypothetical protein
MKPTPAAWALFFTGYIILIIVDTAVGVSFGAFQAIVYALMIPAVYLLYKGSKGKGATGIRILLVITQFWIGYALASLIWLVCSQIAE